MHPLKLGSMTSIESATVYIRDLMCQSDALTLDCYIFNGSTWRETSTVDWSTVDANNYAESLLDTHEISYSDGLEMDVSHYYDYDITDALEAWNETLGGRR